MEFLIEREILLKRYLLEEDFSRFICPTCKKSLLQIDKDGFKYSANKLGRLYHEYADIDGTLEPIGVFECLLICSDAQCQESISCSGDYNFKSFNDIMKAEYIPKLSPKYFCSYLCLFKISEECPDSVKQAIEESFATFFSSITATTNSIRISIEALLREHKISSTNERGKFIPLHRRIENISETSELYPFKDQLLTLKYMGNDGSHNESEVSKEDIVDAYEVLSDILEKRYAQKQDISNILKRLNNKFKK